METHAPQSGRSHRGPGDRSPPGRRAAGVDESTETINIEAKLVGLIIGRQGDNLRRIESDTGTRIQFLDSPENNPGIRPCRITGGKVARSDAKTEIYRMINENNASRGPMGGAPDRFGSRGQQEPPGRPAGYGDEEGTNTQMMVPDRTVGLIIGRGGETIKDLQDRSGCHVIIAPEDKSLNGLRPVNLSGTSRAIQHAKDLILEIVETDSRQGGPPPPREPRYAPDRDSGGPPAERGDDSIFIPKEAVGMIIGKGTAYFVFVYRRHY